MGKFWGAFFGLVLLACFVSIAISPAMGWWLPLNIASFGDKVDFLFYVILYITGFFFVLTEAILVVAMWKFGHDPNRRATYIHGNHKLEMFWTIVPAGILLYISFAQIPTWAAMKSAESTSWFVWGSVMDKGVPPDMVMQVTAQQWEWNMRYSAEGKTGNYKLVPDAPREWAEKEHPDDLHGVNELHTWKNANVRVYLRTRDVIHSFFLPNMRFKQDALPGRTIAIWFQPIEANCKFDEKSKRSVPLDVTDAEPGTDPWKKSKNEWEIACAELCGPRHYAMRGRLYVHESQEDYKKWLDHAKAEATRSKPDERRPTPEKKDS